MSNGGHGVQPQGNSQDAGHANHKDVYVRTLAKGFVRLQFPATLETAYRQFHAGRAFDIIARMLPWVTLLYLSAAAVMFAGGSATGFNVWMANAFWPVMGAIAWLWVARFAGLLARAPHLHTGIAVGIALFATTRSIFVLADETGVIYATYQVIYLLFIAFTVAQLRLPQALAWTLGVAVLLAIDAPLENLNADWLAFGQYFVATLLISAVIGHLIEHRERTAWLQGEIAALEKLEMKALQESADAEAHRQRALGEYLEQVAGNLTATEIAGRSLQFLVDRTGAHVGTVYLVDESALRRAASYGLEGESRRGDHLDRGESLVGQVALEGRRLRLTHLPANYHAVRTATGSAPPAELLVEPVQHQGTSLAVIELGALTAFDETTVELISRIVRAMGVTLVAANARDALARAGMSDFML